MLHGQFSSFGQFDQCIHIKSPLLQQSEQERETADGRHIYGRYCTVHFAAITPPIEEYDSSWEALFRSHPYFNNYLIEILKKFNLDNYIHQNFALFITQATDRVDDNIYHNGICIPHTCSGADLAKVINEGKNSLLRIFNVSQLF